MRVEMKSLSDTDPPLGKRSRFGQFQRAICWILIAALPLSSVSCVTAPSGEQAMAALSGTDDTAAVMKRLLSFVIGTVGDLYIARDAENYRTLVMQFLREARGLDPADATEVLENIGAELAKTGRGDGVETILIALTDLVMKYGDASLQSRAADALASLGNKTIFAGDPAANIYVPFGSGGMLVDIDGRASRELFNQLRLVGPRSIRDLLGAQATKDALCDLSTQLDQNGVEVATDVERKNNCADHGSAGPPGRGGIQGTLGGLANGACLNAGPHFDDDTIVRDRQTLDDINKCFEDPARGFGPGPKVADGGIITIPLLIAIFSAGVAITALLVSYYGAQQTGIRTRLAHDQALRELRDKVVNATRALEDATTQLNRAVADHREAHAARVAAEKAWNAAKGKKDEAAKKKALDDAKKDEKNKERAKDDAAEKAKRAAEDVKRTSEDYQKAVKAGDPVDERSAKACGSALQLERARDAHRANWRDAKALLDNVINPAPDGTNPLGELLTTPVCGRDGHTLQNLQSSCTSVVMCGAGLLPDAQCGCSGAKSEDARLWDSMMANACSHIRCSDGSDAIASARGIACQCESPSRGGDNPRPNPSPEFMDLMFGFSGSTDQLAEMSLGTPLFYRDVQVEGRL